MARKTKIDEFALSATRNINYLVDTFCNGEQKTFCDKTGLSKGSVSQYCSGKNVPNNITAKKIAVAFNVSPTWVMGFSDVMVELGNVKSNEPDKTMTKEEMEILRLYRYADALTKAMVKRTLRMDDSECNTILAARPNANPNAGDSDSPEDDLSKLEDGK